MQVQRKLSLGRRDAGGGAPLIMAALRNRQCLSARYNSGEVLIAPYLLYERHEVAHLAAVTLNRDGRELKGDRLSVYRVPGLTDLALNARPFVPARELLDSHSHPVDRLVATAFPA